MKFDINSTFSQHFFLADQRVHVGRWLAGPWIPVEPDEGSSSDPADDATDLVAGKPLRPLLDPSLADISQDAHQLRRLLPHAQYHPWLG